MLQLWAQAHHYGEECCEHQRLGNSVDLQWSCVTHNGR